MGVKELWTKALGQFRDEDLRYLHSLADKRVVIDTSAWVHRLDPRHDVAYARSSEPCYAALGVKTSFAAKHRAMTELGFKCIYVFDGKTPDIKKLENERRRKEAEHAKVEYDEKIRVVMDRNAENVGIFDVSDAELEDILKSRRDTARPTTEDFANLCQWMNENNIEYVQAPFEADAQMTQLVKDGKAGAAITEDGDLIVYRTAHICSRTKVDTQHPERSKCQYFDFGKLTRGGYSAEIAKGNRLDYLEEISCLLGNDYIARLYGNGPATVLQGTNGRRPLIDQYIDHVQSGKPEREFLLEVERSNKKNSHPDGCWTERFIQSRNLICHYPVFKREGGQVKVVPLNPLPADVSYGEWGTLIGFEKHPQEYLQNGALSEYYSMGTIASVDCSRSDHLGPRYSPTENSSVHSRELLPIFAKLDFDKVPAELQPASVLRYWLLHRGISTTENESDNDVRSLVLRAIEEERVVLPPSMTLEPVKWVGFEPLAEAELGDEYDDWVSWLIHIALSLLSCKPQISCSYFYFLRIETTFKSCAS